MDQVQIFWDPKGIELDSLGKKTKSGDPADGDTPYIRMPIRMLGIDTPETKYGGSEKTVNNKLDELKDLFISGKFDAWIEPELKNHLLPKLGNNAGTLHINQGNQAKDHFKDLLETRLTKPNGKKRSLYIKAADEHFDKYGRLLAYISPSYTKEELSTLSSEKRKTFNLLLIESGWASTIMIYPNLPKNSDLRLAVSGAKNAFDQKIGAWGDVNLLTAYEYRMCLKLHKACKKAKASEGFFVQESSWVQRYSVDVTTLKIFDPQKYFKIPPYHRLFIWPGDVRKAVGELNLKASE